jgi:hypothetical protein
MDLLSSARMVFLSKNKSEIIASNNDDRILAIYPLFIGILEKLFG